jgi:hypothetical protein
MRRYYIIVVLLASIVNSSALQAQQNDAETPLAHKHRVNFSIPDAPAFKLLGTYPSNILKPVSVRDLAIGISDFLGSDNSIVLPQSFSVEFSPGLLIGGKTLTLTEYKKHPALYRTRLSFATNRPEDGSSATALGFGIRVTQIDESDLRTDSTYVEKATELAEEITRIVAAERESLGPLVPLEQIKESPEVKGPSENMERAFCDFKEKLMDEKWNARILEYAVALRATSPDSLGQNLKIDNVAAWYTSGYGFGSWGQLLLGLNGTYEKDSLDGDYEPSVSLSSRFYIGTNQYKVFAEGQWSIEDERKPQWLLNGGGEVKLSGSIWANFSAGTEYVRDTKKTRLVTDFTLKYGF